MDINDFRAWHTVLMFISFMGIFLWAWSKKTKKRFEDAAQLPFNEPDFPKTQQGVNNSKGDTA